MNLEWRDVDLKSNNILIRKTKEGKQKVIPISKRLKDILKGMKKKDNYVLPRFNESTWTHVFKKALREAGLQGNLHWLRHSTGTNLLLQEVPIQVVSQMLGHSDIRVTSLYSHSLQKELKKASEKLKFGSLVTLLSFLIL